MAQLQGTFDTYDAGGPTGGNIREDLSDVIYNISPTDTPFMSSIGRATAKNTFHEWQTDSLAAAVTTNAVIEGDEATLETATASTRVGNYCQISDKTAIITGTMEAVDKAGRTREMAYQIAKRGKELKRDCEAQLTANSASLAGTSVAARTSGGLRAWISTNDSMQTNGASGGFSAGIVAAASDGNQRALTEALLKGVIQSCWIEGGQNDLILVGPHNRTVVSGFASTAATVGSETSARQHTISQKDRRLIATIDFYESDFGVHKVVADRFSPDRNCYVLDTDYWAVAYLRTFRQWPLSKTGDTEKRQLLVEYTLEARNEASSGVVADLATS